MTANVFGRRLTPSASEYKIFLMNLRIVFKNTDSYNLKLKATLALLFPLAETATKKYFYSKAVSRFKKTGGFC